MLISFCTTCHNRAHQLRQVFQENLQTVLNDAETEWVILNFNSNDNLHLAMLERLPSCRGRVVYARETSGRKWDCSLAKNIAHKISNGEVLMNLDGDNRIGNAISEIRANLTSGVDALHLHTPTTTEGTFGRIVVRRELFFRIGGYDESFFPMGYQDADILERIKRVAVLFRIPCPPGISIPNSKADSIRHCRVGQLTWRAFHQINNYISANNLQVGRLVANEGRPWGAGQVEFFAAKSSQPKIG